MQTVNNSNGTKWLQENIKFWIIIISIVISSVAGYYALKGQVAMNTYRLNEVEKARAEVWAKQDKLNENQTALLQQLNSNMVVMLEYYKKNTVK